VEKLFLEKEWTNLCERVRRAADHIDNGLETKFAGDVSRFTSQSVPQNYPELLERTREAAGLAQRWRHQTQSP
jgi:hypothetical protein